MVVLTPVAPEDNDSILFSGACVLKLTFNLDESFGGKMLELHYQKQLKMQGELGARTDEEGYQEQIDFNSLSGDLLIPLVYNCLS